MESEAKQVVYNLNCFIAADDWESALNMESNVIKLLRQLRKDSVSYTEVQKAWSDCWVKWH